MTPRSTARRCAHCAQAKALIDSLAGTGVHARTLPLPDLVVNMSAMLYVALSPLFSELDYEAKKESNSAIAVRILATVTERFSHVDEGAERMRQSWLRSLRHTPLARVRLRAKRA